jgi:Flp pilus assembly protein TadG
MMYFCDADHTGSATLWLRASFFTARSDLNVIPEWRENWERWLMRAAAHGARAVSWLKRHARNFAGKPDGSVTIEFVLWMPVLLLILAFSADASQLYLIRANMWTVAGETARRMTTGQLNSGTAQAFAAGQLLYPNLPYTYSFVQGSATASPPVDDVAEISIPVANASVFGVLAVWGNFTNSVLDAKVTMRSEQ